MFDAATLFGIGIAVVLGLPLVGLAIYALCGGQFAAPSHGAPKSKSGPIGNAFGLLFTLFWTVCVVCFDVGWGTAIVKQCLSSSFEPIEGTVVRSAVKEEADSEGTRYLPEVEYQFTVNGTNHHGTRVRYFSFWDEASAGRFVAEHPVGSPIVIHFDPQNPARSLLDPGLGGTELFQIMFLLPFNMVTLLLLIGLGALWRRGEQALQACFGGKANGRVLDGFAETRIRLPTASPTACMLLTLACMPIPGVFVAFCCGGMPPSLEVMAAVWIVVLGSAAGVFIKQARTAASPRNDLVINHRLNTLTLPPNECRPARIVVKLAALTTLDVAERIENDGEGETRRFVMTLHWRHQDGSLQETKITELSDAEQANELAALIRMKLGLPSS